ncbi:efflux RND transporter periplasmic adaptor subunit [Bradyrhizobium uaiense]|uniref:Efflux RND transporter periplasmic adaptor subunit n=1 Tax=Bradyrhizobium uaiense TaxID=2594946 RepID=A0A6P1BDX6_9BRAD|nr:efflux RND transporter periplasmic adaptor subunit [Bradyrhizobium uaiense]NEU96726.1 efflux RND transporter periplasmic adaptor subunit [Bradyrhizobium uaiense]
MYPFAFAVARYLSILVVFSFVGTCALAQQAPPAAVAVGTVAAERKPIERSGTLVGRIEAVQRVEVRARVTGYLEEVLFKEGDLVKEGAPLYRIERGLFEAAVTAAQAALDRSKAAKVLTEIQFKRAQELLDKATGTAVARDQALAADQQADAQILSDQANLETAKINLGYTEINSPIAGKIDKTNITKGNVVGPNSGVLTTIVSQDPMYVSFPVSQRDYLEARERSAKFGKVKVKIRFSDGKTYGQIGEINFVSVSVSRSTDTILARATIPNPDGVLIDGQLVQVILESGEPEEKVLVPQAALIADQAGTYVFVVEDGKAVVKRIKIGAEIGADVVVDQGLKGGEQVIVQGIQAVRAGAPVQAAPLPKTIDRS